MAPRRGVLAATAARPGGGKAMDLFHSMEAFICVAEMEGFASAARKLGVAKSVVTTRVQQLEEHLGVALFHRSTRAVKLSEVGRSYYQECSEVMLKLEELSHRSQREKGALRGMLRICVLPGFAIGHFSKALVDFRKLHPQIEFEITVNDRVVDPVQEGLDLVFQIFPPASNLLIERRMFPVRGLFCAAPEYLEKEAPIETPLDLRRHHFGHYSFYPWGDKWSLSRGKDHFDIVLSPVLRTNCIHLLLEFARAASGVVYLPTMVAASDLLEGRLVEVLPKYLAPPLWLSAMYPASHRMTTKIRVFLDFLRSRFPSEPQWDKALGLLPLEEPAPGL
jgi:DNA-binding transcriptional LysR family regulator